VIDSHSVKTTERGGVRGFDAGKKIKGRKRHIITDTCGYLVAFAKGERAVRGQAIDPAHVGLAADQLGLGRAVGRILGADGGVAGAQRLGGVVEVGLGGAEAGLRLVQVLAIFAS
jgi:hypothetical protein